MIRRLASGPFHLAARAFEIIALGLYAMGGWIGGESAANNLYTDDFSGEPFQ